MKIYFYILLFLLPLTAVAQQPDSLFKKISRQLNLNDTAKHSDLFLHLDKSVYAANENIWFAAYLMHAAEIQEHHTLHVILVNEMDKTVVASQKFAMENGLASANFPIPDSLLSGQYCLVAYTNKLITEKKPHVFRQPINIIGLRKDPFKLRVSGYQADSAIYFTVNVSKTEDVTKIRGNIAFTVTVNGKPYKGFNEKFINSSEFKFTLPASLANQSLAITGKIELAKDQMAFNRPLTWASENEIVDFSGNCGNLLNGQITQLACCLRNTLGQALSRQCVLYGNNNEIVSFATDTDGNALFRFKPESGEKYYIKTKGEDPIPIQNFPVITNDAWNLMPVKRVVNDTIKVIVDHPDTTSECVLFIHNGQSMLLGAYLKLNKKETLLSIPIKSWEPGLVHVCLFDKACRLQQDRLISIENNKQYSVILKTDSTTYKPLSKTTIRLKVVNSKGEPVRGIFSFSCALQQAITPAYKNIQAFDSFERYLPDITVFKQSSGKFNERRINNLLLNFESVLSSSASDSISNILPGTYDGYVLHNEKKIKKPVDMMIAGGQTAMFKTDIDGHFNLPYLPLRTQNDVKILLTVLDKNQSDFKIEMKDRWAGIDDYLAKQQLFEPFLRSDEFTEAERSLLASNNHLLKEVVITAKKTQQTEYNGKPNSSGVCHDYVCQFNVLNCPYHVGVKMAEEGQVYNYETFTGSITVIYHCPFKTMPSFVTSIHPTITYVPYVPFNPNEPNPDDVKHNTTQYWQAMVNTDENGEAVISFNNNARPGTYKAIVQGIANDGVFSSQASYDVK